MTDWRDRLDELPRDHRIKALLAFELASDRAAGESVDVAAATLRAVARAEGLDTGQAWIEAAALDIAPPSHGEDGRGTPSSASSSDELTAPPSRL